MSSSSPIIPPYHEKQSYFNQMCLMHVLNMIAGSPQFTKQELDDACQLLSPSSGGMFQKNPHTGWLGGNYDVNVAMYILQNELNLSVQYFDSRQDANEIFNDKNSSTSTSIYCLLLNVPSIVSLFGGRHWICYKLVDGQHWFRLNSFEKGPILVEDIVKEMKMHLQRGDTILTISKQRKIIKNGQK